MSVSKEIVYACGTITSVVRIVWIFMLLAFIFFIFAFSIDEWSIRDENWTGLSELCFKMDEFTCCQNFMDQGGEIPGKVYLLYTCKFKFRIYDKTEGQIRYSQIIKHDKLEKRLHSAEK